MGSLIKNERVKLYKRKSTLVILLVVLGLYIVQFTIMALLPTLIRQSGEMGWEDAYRNQIADYERMAADNAKPVDPESGGEIPADLGIGMELRWMGWLLEHEVHPRDWRADAALAYFQADAAVQSGDPSPEDADRAEQLKPLLDRNDWRAYVTYRLQTQWFDGDVQTAAELQAEEEFWQQLLDLNVPPASTQTEGHLRYYSSYSLDDDPFWRAQQLEQVRTNRVALLRGEVYGQLLNGSQRRQLEQENAVLLKQVRTDTPPLVMQSFWGWMDSNVVSSGFLLIAMLGLAGGIIAGEFSSGTIKLLLITPHKRQKIFWAKVYVLVESILLLAVAIAVIGALVSALTTMGKGIGAWQITTLFGQVVRMPFAVFFLLKYLLSLLPVLAMGAMGLMFSSLVRKGGLAIALPFITYYLGQMITMIISQVFIAVFGSAPEIMSFIVFSHLSVQEHLPGVTASMLQAAGSGTLLTGGVSLFFAICVLSVYTALFLWIARDSFVRQDVK